MLPDIKNESTNSSEVETVSAVDHSARDSMNTKSDLGVLQTFVFIFSINSDFIQTSIVIHCKRNSRNSAPILGLALMHFWPISTVTNIGGLTETSLVAQRTGSPIGLSTDKYYTEQIFFSMLSFEPLN